MTRISSKWKKNLVSVRSLIFEKPSDRIRQEYLPAILCRSFSATTTHCGHELGKPRLRPSASTLSHLSGLGETSIGHPTATSGRQAFLTSMVAIASAGGTWVDCYIAERTPNGNCTPHHCLQVDGDLNRPTTERYQSCHPAQTCAQD